MGPEEIARSPWRNALTRSLGTQESVDVDLFGPFEIPGRPHTVMLCSDGLYRALNEDAAWHHLLASPDPGTGARVLADLALRHGSDDNISVAVVQFEGAPVAARAGRGTANAVAVPVGALASDGGKPRWRPRASPAPASGAPKKHSGQKRPASISARPSLLRRSLAVAFSDNVLFGLCTGILVMWLALRLMQG
jgi:hypothetical protein